MLFPLLCLVAAITLPPPTSTNVVDGAALFTDDERATIASEIATIKKERAVSVGVLTIDQLDDDPKAVAVRTLNYWQMGPDSVLLLVSMSPRKLYLQPGSNLAYLFDTTNSSTITNSMVPLMKSKNFLGAVLEGLHRIDSTLGVVGQRVIVGTVKPPEPKKDVAPAAVQEGVNSGLSPTAVGLLFFLGAAGLILAIGLAMRASKKRRYEDLDRDTGYAPLRQQSAFIPPPSIAPAYAVSDASIPVAPAKVQKQLSTHTTKKRQYSPPPVPPVVQQTVVVDSGNDNFATGMLVGQALERASNPLPPPVATVPAPKYSPPRSPPRPRYSPPAPRYSPPSYSGGGGSDWGSSDSGGSSDGGGGGGSDW